MNDRHPHRHTLSLLRLAIDALPPTFSPERAEAYRERLRKFEGDPEIGYPEISRTIAEFGRESWPWRRAYGELYEAFGNSSEEAHLLEALDRDLREKYERFIHDGGKISHLGGPRVGEEIYRPSPFESYFSPEEKFAIQQALLSARQSARREIDELATGPKADEYAAALERRLAERDRIGSLIEDLKAMASVSRRWQPEIEDRIRTLEEGWSVLGTGLGVEEASREVEHWKGVLASFLHR